MVPGRVHGLSVGVEQGDAERRREVRRAVGAVEQQVQVIERAEVRERLRLPLADHTDLECVVAAQEVVLVERAGPVELVSQAIVLILGIPAGFVAGAVLFHPVPQVTADLAVDPVGFVRPVVAEVRVARVVEELAPDDAVPVEVGGPGPAVLSERCVGIRGAAGAAMRLELPAPLNVVAQPVVLRELIVQLVGHVGQPSLEEEAARVLNREAVDCDAGALIAERPEEPELVPLDRSAESNVRIAIEQDPRAFRNAQPPQPVGELRPWKSLFS